MSFIERLANSTDSKYSAYLSFISGRGREGFRFYAFVEDEDDIEFYQHVIDEVDVNFLGCGGKSNVIAIHTRIAEEGLLDECWFLVDRDHEIEPFHNGDTILRTSGYSWENHCLEEEVIHHFLSRKISPMPSNATVERLINDWQLTLKNFSEILSLQYVLIRISHCERIEANVSDTIPTINMSKTGIICNPCPSVLDFLNNRKIEISNHLNDKYPIDELSDPNRFYDIHLVCRGKTGFLILRAFLETIQKVESREFRVQINSALNIIKNVSSNLKTFDYIRDYSQSRR